MKKLMVAAAVAVLGFAVNAAGYNWSAGSSWCVADGDSSGGEYEGYGVYFFDASQFDQSAFLAAVASSGADAFDSALGSGTISGDMFMFTGDGLGDDGAETPYAHGYVVLVDGATAASATGYFMSDVADVEITSSITSGSSAMFSWDELYAGDHAGWTAIAASAAPEPTSGLLLLLGVAGLALRRRRA